MPKQKVRRYFADEYTGKRYKEGDTFEGTAERIEELRQRGVLGTQPVPEPQQVAVEDSEKGGK